MLTVVNTIPGTWYTITCTAAASVTQLIDGKSAVLASLDKSGTTSFRASASSVTVNTEGNFHVLPTKAPAALVSGGSSSTSQQFTDAEAEQLRQLLTSPATQFSATEEATLHILASAAKNSNSSELVLYGGTQLLLGVETTNATMELNSQGVYINSTGCVEIQAARELLLDSAASATLQGAQAFVRHRTRTNMALEVYETSANLTAYSSIGLNLSSDGYVSLQGKTGNIGFSNALSVNSPNLKLNASNAYSAPKTCIGYNSSLDPLLTVSTTGVYSKGQSFIVENTNFNFSGLNFSVDSKVSTSISAASELSLGSGCTTIIFGNAAGDLYISPKTLSLSSAGSLHITAFKNTSYQSYLQMNQEETMLKVYDNFMVSCYNIGLKTHLGYNIMTFDSAADTIQFGDGYMQTVIDGASNSYISFLTV